MILSYGAHDPLEPSADLDWKSAFAKLWVRADGRLDRVLEDLRDLVQRSGGDWEDVLKGLEREGILRREDEGFEATAHGRQVVRDSVLDQVFGNLAGSLPGSHAAPRSEGRGLRERIPSTRPWESGDDPRDIDWGSSLRNVLRRGGDASRLREGDLESWETEPAAGCATVVMIDVSHSMILYGEDRITPAKMVAIALAEHIRRRHPRDSLDVVAFGNEAWRIPVDSIAELSVGPFHTNTAAGLKLAREILRGRRASDRRILMITDGKPSCVFDRGRLYRNSGDLDPRVVELTLAEGRRCLRDGCGISTFMVAQDPVLLEFVDLFTRAVHGQAFHTGLDRLGEFVLRDWAASRSRRRE
jgi:uncharacterized protein with von Willebrand factor type A (vWA) domain